MRRVLIPRDVDNAEGEIRVLRDDIVHHRGDATLEVGVGGLHDDGNIDIRVFGVGIVLPAPEAVEEHSGFGTSVQSLVVSFADRATWCVLGRARRAVSAGPACGQALPGEGAAPEERVFG